MHVITRRRLLEFGERHPDAVFALDRWYRIVKQTDFGSFADLQRTFPTADQVDGFTVFNIGGNKYRLVAYIVYKLKRLYIRYIMTHSEYDRNKWREAK